MSRPDLILLHPPSVFNFREQPAFYGPVSDMVPSSSIFEIYPIGFITISNYLESHGLSVRIVNLALKMLRNNSFDAHKFIKRLNAVAYGIDLHWLPHADGSLSLAELIKKYHPGKPVILGGLTSTYYYEEIMRDHPYVDFVVRGDSTEEPIRMLVEAIKSGGRFDGIPNLVWRKGNGAVMVNELTYRPPDLDVLDYDYFRLFKMALKYIDPTGYIPFNYWLAYPVMAVFQCRGCVRSCASCAGSAPAFRKICLRERPCFRSPERLAEDIRKIAEYTRAPIMVIGDLFQDGEEYAERFLDGLKRQPVENEITVEFFSPPPRRFVNRIAGSVKNFNVEMSPESHDFEIRKTFGKTYTNAELENAVESLLISGCRRIDLFFMIGLPHQNYESVIETVRYCEALIRKFNGRGRVLPMISPLAPFIDPGSSIFENPERHGYKLFYRTLADHRKAMLMPSWKLTLNYETQWMTRDDIVRATYDSALALLDVKEKYNIIKKERAEALRDHIIRARAVMNRIDRSGLEDQDLREEVQRLNGLESLCDKHELDWPIKGMRLRLWKVIRLLLRRSMKQ